MLTCLTEHRFWISSLTYRSLTFIKLINTDGWQTKSLKSMNQNQITDLNNYLP